MLHNTGSLSPGETLSAEQRQDAILAFWELLRVGVDPGETTWAELEVLYKQVTAALAENPHDLTTAEGLTAYAALLMTNSTNL